MFEYDPDIYNFLLHVKAVGESGVSYLVNQPYDQGLLQECQIAWLVHPVFKNIQPLGERYLTKFKARHAQAGEEPPVLHVHLDESQSAPVQRSAASKNQPVDPDDPPPNRKPLEPEGHGHSVLVKNDDLHAIPVRIVDQPRAESDKSSADQTPLPTIWYHGEMSYSSNGLDPICVNQEQHNILQLFLDRNVSLVTKALKTSNVTTVVDKLVARFGAGAIRRPQTKGDGYFIRVQSINFTN